MSKKGAGTGSMDNSPARKKRQAQKRRREEARWAAKSGPVTVRRVGDPPPSPEAAPDAE